MTTCAHENVAWGWCSDCDRKLTPEELAVDYARVDKAVAKLREDGMLREERCPHCGTTHECLRVLDQEIQDAAHCGPRNWRPGDQPFTAIADWHQPTEADRYRAGYDRIFGSKP